MSACALCNRTHDGDCVGRIKNCCLLCGDSHNAFVACPCPRCLHRHDSLDCASVEDWRGNSFFHFESFVRDCCLLCGHGPLPCSRLSGNLCALCNIDHEGSCGGVMDRCCLICGEVHKATVACPCLQCHHYVGVCECKMEVERNDSTLHGERQDCLLCGETHQSLRSCPCPRCYSSHANDDCPRVSATSPCPRCNVWHGVDVCARSDAPSNSHNRQPVPRASMVNRAVHHVAGDASNNEMSAPARSDAASDRHDVGSMSMSCNHCGARFWLGEKINCCFDGSLSVPEAVVPESLASLIFSSAIRQQLRSYNMAMSLASVGHDKRGFPDGVFVMSGKSYHHIGSMLPNDGHPLCFAQIYSLDTAPATERRASIFSDRLDRQVLSALHDELLQHNRYVSEFAAAVASDVPELIWTTDDSIMGMGIGALVSAVGRKRSIVIKRRDNASSLFAHTVDSDQQQRGKPQLQFIDDGHALYHTLTYPLLFPTGARGWFAGMTRYERDNQSQHRVSLHDYGRYMLMHRER